MILAGSNQHVPKTGGRQAKPKEWKAQRGARVRALRTRLELTHDQVAERGGFDRSKMSKFESGENAATTDAALRELARGFGVAKEIVAQYLDGELTLDEVLVSPAPVVTLDQGFRYDSLRLVLEHRSTRGRWSDEAIAAVKSKALKSDVDPGEQYWKDQLDRFEQALKLADLPLPPKVPTRATSDLDELDAAPPSRPRRKR